MQHRSNDDSPQSLSRKQALKILAGGAAAVAFSPLIAACTPGNGSGPSMSVLAPAASNTYPFRLPKLDYSYSALDPYIDTDTMEIHHSMHHQGYTNKLNKALEGASGVQGKSIIELLSNLDAVPEQIRGAVRNSGGSYFNHALFWNILTPNASDKPSGKLASAIDRDFGSFDAFRDTFSMAASKVFGSGWTWLVSGDDGKLEVLTTSNQDTPLALGKKPVIALDVWEHAYYLNYQNRRSEYIMSFWSVINWDQATRNLG